MNRSRKLLALTAGVVLSLFVFANTRLPIVQIATGVAVIAIGVAAGIPMWRGNRRYALASVAGATLVVGIGLALVAIQ